MEDTLPNALIDTAIARVRAYRACMGWTPAHYAREAQLPDSTTRKMDKGDWNPTANTLRALEKPIPPKWMPPAAEREAA